MNNSRPASIESPCVQICELDAQDICVGCGRSLDEIGQWLEASEQEKAEICSLARQRLAQSSQLG